jgi:hypothetical protein
MEDKLICIIYYLLFIDNNFSLLGKEYMMHPHRHPHCNAPGFKGQQFHKVLRVMKGEKREREKREREEGKGDTIINNY